MNEGNHRLNSEDTEKKSVRKIQKQVKDNNEYTDSIIEIDNLFLVRIDLLRKIISEINTEIHDRKLLRNGALKEIEEELNELSVLLNEITPMGKVNVSGEHLDSLNARRIHLEKSIARLHELKRTHKINTWKDVVALKKELFKLLPEYVQLLQLRKVIE